jgi:hypothetical protein
MSDLHRFHCRHCEQTFFTTTAEPQKCDLCGKAGGLVSPLIAAAEERERERQRAEKEKQRNKPFSWRDMINLWFMLMVIYGSWYSLTQPGEWGSYTRLYNTGLIVVGCIGMLVVWRWPKKNSADILETNSEKNSQGTQQSG